MGIGKTIVGVAISKALYAENIDEFVFKVAHQFEANMAVFHYYSMSDGDEKWREEDLRNFGYNKTYRLTVDQGIFDEIVPYYYELWIPVDSPNDDELTICFESTGVVLFHFLTYDHAWVFLFDALCRSEVPVAYLNAVRLMKSGYESIFRKLNISELLVYGDYDYQSINQFLYEGIIAEDLQDIIAAAMQIDKLHVVDFDELLTGIRNNRFPQELLTLKADKIVIHHQLVSG